MSTTTQFAKKRLSSNRCLTPTGAFSCSTSIFFKVSASLRRFNKSLPSWRSCLEQNLRHKILKLRFIHLHASLRHIWFSLPSLFCERLLKTRLVTRVYGGKKRQLLLFFSGLVSPCFISFIKLVKGDFFHILKFKVTYSSFRFEVSFNSSPFRRIRSS